jgi:hypothetical protein
MPSIIASLLTTGSYLYYGAYIHVPMRIKQMLLTCTLQKTIKLYRGEGTLFHKTTAV